eukprot:TRINITY_DN1005_c0_g1_i2.p1 TRINITY_DN1005_c0_g1~~TRINITY_DN1005_c0_g1_i2.p1  ORF type:complete len:318 (-),score=50.47 TRINITY_DN1005_c0_g1_i2:417-1370(-)
MSTASSSPSAPSASPKALVVKNYSKALNTLQQFTYGAIAGCIASAMIHPLDMIKVRLQLSGELGASKPIRNPFKMGRLIWVNEGPMALYKGLTAGLLRQVTYGMTRLGVFQTVVDTMKRNGYQMTALPLIFAGSTAGVFAVMVGSPADVALTRMQADNTLPAAQRRKYKNVFDAMRRMVKEEGFTCLWRGNIPNLIRSIVMNTSVLATFEYSKNWIAQRTKIKGYKLSFCGSMVSGLLVSVIGLPFDFLKVRIQKQMADPQGKLAYKNAFHCAMKVMKTEGLLSMYKGFVVFYFRCAPHAVVTLCCLDQLNRMFPWQ